VVFSDPLFILAFLPVALLVFHSLAFARKGTWAVASLVGASLFFYAYWSVPFMFLLLGQIGVNYWFAGRIQAAPDRRGLLWAAVTFNLALLGYFKYRNFFLENVGYLFGTHFNLAPLIVPLAISFHTFQQIALLVDVRDGEAEVPPLLDYVFFVVFFPQLIAGPIVLHREMGKQVRAVKAGQGRGLDLFGPGLFLFVLGLFKKVCLADLIGPYADNAFLPGQHLQWSEAWCGSVAYALQLYFDFSGYSDMAVGLGCMFGFRLPNNFLLPFASRSMIEYWKRWHITMTRFFTMYTYMPVALAAMRYSERVRLGRLGRFVLGTAAPTLLTFFLSGLWHGAGWTFVCFGVVNGLGLLINHAWIEAKLPRPPRPLGWGLTMLTVLVTLVYFRSQTLGQADYMLHQMFFPDRLLVAPQWLAGHLPHLTVPTAPFLVLADAQQSLYLVLLILLLAPLSVLIPAFSAKPEGVNPSWRRAFAVAAMSWLVVGLIGEPRSFLYFAF
jgi:alginate O-acetyltransferase complex protein AlgI